MEVWALEGFGVAHILQEMLTYKSDHIKTRQEVLGTTIIGGTIPKPTDAPESFRLLILVVERVAQKSRHKVRILALPVVVSHRWLWPPREGGLHCPPPKLRRKSLKPIPGNSEAS
ncbi:hypothetical protein Fmac_018206 [Flemingia macrophylla]|uniref:DNA-directed RNA polymerase n=1 Tax=Flemingia macrophylla TaxID=520843 RepID=A0ABD1M4B5_9FABA